MSKMRVKHYCIIVYTNVSYQMKHKNVNSHYIVLSINKAHTKTTNNKPNYGVKPRTKAKNVLFQWRKRFEEIDLETNLCSAP